MPHEGGQQWFAAGQDLHQSYYQAAPMYAAVPQGTASYPVPPYSYPMVGGMTCYSPYYMTGQQYTISGPYYAHPATVDKDGLSAQEAALPATEWTQNLQADPRAVQWVNSVPHGIQSTPSHLLPGPGYGYKTPSSAQVPDLSHSATHTPAPFGMPTTPGTGYPTADHDRRAWTSPACYDRYSNSDHQRGYSQDRGKRSPAPSWPSITSVPSTYSKPALEMTSVTSSLPSPYDPRRCMGKAGGGAGHGNKQTKIPTTLPSISDWPSVTSVPSEYGRTSLEMASVTSIGDTEAFRGGHSDSDSEDSYSVSASESNSKSPVHSHTSTDVPPLHSGSVWDSKWEREVLVSVGLRQCRLCRLWTAHPQDHVCKVLRTI